MKANTHKHS